MATIHDILKNESEFREQQAENIRFMAGAIERIRIAVGLNKGELFTTYAVAVEEAVIERDTLRATVSDLRDVCKTWEATAASDIKQINKLYADIAALEKGVDEMRNWGSERAILQARVAELEAEVERLKVRDLEWTTILPGCAHPDDLAETVREALAGAEREVERLQERTLDGCAGSAPVFPGCGAKGKAVESFRWSCGVCHHGWDTEPAPTPDNAALRQRVFEHLGALILNEKAGWGGLPDLVAQFDLLGRDL